MNKYKLVLLLGILGTSSLLSGCVSEKPKAEEASSPKTLAKVQNELDVYGNVKVDKSEEILIDFPAKVKEIYVNDGENVKKGDKLLSLDFEDYALQIKTKENEIQIDEIELRQLEANSNPQMLEANRIRSELRIKENYVATGEDPDLKPLQNSLDILEKSITLSKNDYETSKKLFEEGLISEEEWTLCEQNLKSKEKEKQDTLTAIEKVKTNRNIEINALTAQLKSTEMQFNNADILKAANIEALKVKIETNKLALSSMKNKLNKPYLKGSDLVAPSDNLIIYDISCTKGSQLSPEGGPVLKAMYQDTLYVVADIPEESLTLVKVGNSASITLADDTSGEITGKISRISSRAIEKDGDTIVEAIIDIEKGKEFLKPGLTADIKIFVSQ